jgi:hypothetical protein
VNSNTASAVSVPAYAPDEIVTGESTRASRLKWVIVVDSGLPAGRAANAVACVAGVTHPGLAWAGCTVLGASAERLANTRAKVVQSIAEDSGVWLADMPLAGQTTRVYDEYVSELATTPGAGLECLALSIVGPRATVDSLVKKLRLL